MRYLISLLVLAALPFVGSGPARASDGTWTVTLSAKHARKLAELEGKPGVTALAISPDGPWGYAWRQEGHAAAEARALANCRAFLKPGRRDCILYAVNGRRVAPEVVETRKVSKVYRPVDARKAAAVLGLVGGSFQGNPAAALSDLERLVADPGHRRRLTPDARLTGLLRGNSFGLDKSRGTVIAFHGDGGGQHSKAQSGILKLHFPSWIATGDGLVCMFDSYWDNGNAMGTRCLVIDHIQDGKARFRWGADPNTGRKGLLILGDARYGAAR